MTEHPTACDAASPRPLLSVIVPCRGHAEEVEDCLRTLTARRPPFPFEIILVEAGPDPDVRAVAARFPDVRLVRSDTGLAPGPARNLGVRHARGELLAFTDADCRPEPGWLEVARGALEAGGRMVGGPVLDARPFHPVAVSDNLLQFSGHSARRRAGPAEHLPSCNLAIRRRDLAALGGFPDPDTPACEDVLLSGRATGRWPDGIRFVPEMRVRHLGRTGLLAFLRHHEGFGRSRGRLRLLLRPVHVRLGRRGIFVPVVVLRRLAYVLSRTATGRAFGLPRALLLSPLLVLGLVAWAIGFRRGLRQAAPAGAGSARPA